MGRGGEEGAEGGLEDRWVEGLMRQLLCKNVLYEPMKVRLRQ
jgi:Pex19 protein family